MALRDIPADRFPLRLDRYSEIERQLSEAAGDFDDLGYPEIAKKLDTTLVQLRAAWELIRSTESAGL